MSCYFRHLKEVFAEAGIEVSPANKKALDQAWHRCVGVEYKDCPAAWRKLKLELQSGTPNRRSLIEALRREIARL